MKKNIIIILCCLAVSSAFSQGNWELVEEFDRAELGLEPKIAIWARKMQCFDSLNCIHVGVVGGVQTFIKSTTDGGKSWEIIFYDTTDYGKFFVAFKRCDCWDRNNCIIVLDSGYYWRGTNGLKDWKLNRLDTSVAITHMADVSFVNSRFALISANNNMEPVHFVSTDMGLNWQRYKFNLPDSLSNYIYIYGIRITPLNNSNYNSDTLMFVASNYEEKKAYILTTYDNCQTFNVSSNTFSRHDWLQHAPIYFFNTKHGFATANLRQQVGSKWVYTDWIYETTDGGLNWIERYKKSPGLTGPYGYMEFADSLNGICFSGYSNLLITNDGGKSWVKDTTIRNIEFQERVAFLNKTDIISVSTNDGRVYIQRNSPSTSVLNDLKINNTELSIFPNPLPAGAELALEFSQQLAGNVSIELTDILGRRAGETYSQYFDVARQTLHYKSPQGLSPGVYFLRVSAGSEVWARKVIIIDS